MVGLSNTQPSNRRLPLERLCHSKDTRFETEAALAVEAAFDGGRITSDGGLLWLARMDSEMGLCRAVSECVPDEEWRMRRGRHSLSALLKQRASFK